MDGVLTATIQLPIITSDTVATATITGTGSTPATLGVIPSTISLNQNGDAVNIPGNWNVEIQVQPTQGNTWVEFNNNNGTAVINANTAFFIGGSVNSTGSSRSVVASITNRNTRVVTSPDVTKTITITQAG